MATIIQEVLPLVSHNCNFAGDGVVKGSIAGIATSTAAQKMWLVSQALGDIAFAYPYSIILIEIQVRCFSFKLHLNILKENSKLRTDLITI